VVVVLAPAEYERLCRIERLNAPAFTDHLLAMPRDDKPFERFEIALRETGR
jgi:hypothetical protein